ncbi:GNAT family N-acetyltransferase [uncultured Bartonella sp.]|uniref:GNAT family N-acetyltransferase n=1 Tax=uncultured Bartonella sp. TaxID=104108 RepID=UPI00261E54A5|nr:GNAT family N-acetyltransferase [uncultured Bartonella sp.]
MEKQQKIDAVIKAWSNKLEPDYLLACFLSYPPVDFKAGIDELGLPVFSARFDLTTTMDLAERKRLQSLPFYKIWSRRLTFKTLFVGTTVSEFSPLPTPFDSQKAARFLTNEAQKKDYSLVIVKDLPTASALISDEDAQKTAEFLEKMKQSGFISVEGQALAYVPVDYASCDDFLSRFSKNRRKDFRRKMRVMDELDIEVLESNSPALQNGDLLKQFYALYVQVFAQSDIHFDLLSEEFFKKLLQSGDESLRVFVYRDRNGKLLGYNICFVINDMLIDKYIGFDYPQATDNNLYFVSWFFNLEYARLNGLKYYVAGWTDPEIKAYLGAKFVYTRHAVFIRNRLLRWILKHFQHHFESDARLKLQGDDQL